MQKKKTNEERTAEYFQKFNREKILKEIIKSEKPIIFDVGANIGQSLKQFKKLWPFSQVHCFEPQERVWEELDNSAIQFKNDVFINKFALGEENNNSKVFYNHKEYTGLSGFLKVNLNSNDSISLMEAKKNNELKEYQENFNIATLIKMTRADQYINSKDINKINLLKMDVQGYEPQVIKGFGDMLRNIEVVLTELNFYDFYEKSLSFYDIERYLIPYGFRLFDISHISKNPMNGRTDWVDIIYVNKNFINS
tara:strand:- start:166 stop:921 length:756 start_codon:yes stop_codon:yes gene_type:complete